MSRLLAAVNETVLVHPPPLFCPHTLPKRLTVDPDNQPAYQNWRREIDLYREAAGARAAKTLLRGKTLRGTPAARTSSCPPSDSMKATP